MKNSDPKVVKDLMKISLSSGRELETDNLDDKHAELAQAVDTFYKICRKYDVAAICRVAVNKEYYLGCQSIPADQKKAEDDYNFLLKSMASWIEKTSDGQLAVVLKEEPSEEALEE
jgi:hypothetical protein